MNRCSLFLLVLLAALLAVPSSVTAQIPNPSREDTNGWRNRPCNDPWINMAIVYYAGGNVRGRADKGECDIRLYNNGRWNSFNDLVGYVKASRSLGATAVYIPRLGRWATGFARGTTLTHLIGNDAGSLIGADGSTLVGMDGSSLIGNDAGSLIGADGSSLRNVRVAEFVTGYRVAGAGQSLKRGGGSTQVLFK